MHAPSSPVAATGNGNGSSSSGGNAGGGASSSSASSSASSASSAGTAFDPRLSSDEIELWDDNGGPPTPLLVSFCWGGGARRFLFPSPSPLGKRQPLIEKKTRPHHFVIAFFFFLLCSLSFLTLSRARALSLPSTKNPSTKQDTVNYPVHLKNLSLPQLRQLCNELRSDIIHIVSKTGGHLGASLGVTELTVALHYVFNTPDDRIVWDVGHQAYGHKILTGEKEKFLWSSRERERNERETRERETMERERNEREKRERKKR